MSLNSSLLVYLAPENLPVKEDTDDTCEQLQIFAKGKPCKFKVSPVYFIS